MTSSRSSLWRRWTQGQRWSWVNERFRAALPADFAESALSLETSDRFHAKQGRSTARVRFDEGAKTGDRSNRVSGYLKRHTRLPWSTRLAALFDPDGRHSPAAIEWTRLEQAEEMGIPVPQVIAVGERLGPKADLQCYLYVAELEGFEELHLAIPRLRRTPGFESWKRELIRELAELIAQLHQASLFHKDLYLCHLFLDLGQPDRIGQRLRLIDLQRLKRHVFTAPRWRWKDLGQLLFSSLNVEGISDRDRLRFWAHYRRLTGLRWPKRQAAFIRAKAMRYWKHNHPESQSRIAAASAKDSAL